MFSMVLWIYLGFWICFVIGIYKGSEYARDIQSSEYTSVCAWITLEYPKSYPKSCQISTMECVNNSSAAHILKSRWKNE